MLIAIPLLLVSTGFALFSQQLTVNGSATKPAYSSTNNMSMNYSVSYGTSGQKTVYNITMTVKYNGSGTIESWQSAFNVPTDFGSLTCQSTVACTTSTNRVTVANGAGNGTITPSGTVTFTLSFTTSTGQGYVLQNIAVTGILVKVYQTMTGLTFTATPGTRTKSGNKYTWPYTFKVTNGTGQAISAWRFTSSNWTSTETIASVSTTVNYVANTTSLTFSSKTGLASGANITFSGSITSTNANFSLAGSVQGAL
jgi:hypothetical protein